MNFNVFYRPFGPRGKVRMMSVKEVESREKAESTVLQMRPKAVLVGTFWAGGSRKT